MASNNAPLKKTHGIASFPGVQVVSESKFVNDTNDRFFADLVIDNSQIYNKQADDASGNVIANTVDLFDILRNRMRSDPSKQDAYKELFKKLLGSFEQIQGEVLDEPGKGTQNIAEIIQNVNTVLTPDDLQQSDIADLLQRINDYIANVGQETVTSQMTLLSLKSIEDSFKIMNQLVDSSKFNSYNQSLINLFNTLKNNKDVSPFEDINQTINGIFQDTNILAEEFKNEIWTEASFTELDGQMSKLQNLANQVTHLHEQASTMLNDEDIQNISLGQIVNVFDAFSKIAGSAGGIATSIIGLVNTNENLTDDEKHKIINTCKQLSTDNSKIAINKFSRILSNRIAQRLSFISDDRKSNLNQIARSRGLGDNLNRNITSTGQAAANLAQATYTYEETQKSKPLFSFGISFSMKNLRKYATLLSRLETEYNQASETIDNIYTQAEKSFAEGNLEKGQQLLDMYKQQVGSLYTLMERMGLQAERIGEIYNDLSISQKDNLDPAFRENIQTLLRHQSESSRNLVIQAKSLNINIDTHKLRNYSHLAEQFEAYNKALDEQKEKSKNQSKNLTTAYNEARNLISSIRSYTSSIFSTFGLSTLALGPISVATTAFDYSVEQGRKRYASMSAEAFIGVTNLEQSAALAQQQMLAGNELYKLSGGRINQYAIRDTYENLIRNVGAAPGTAPEQVSQDMAFFAEKSVLLQQVFGIEQSTITNTLQTLYRDLNMSANNAGNAFAKLTQQAISANIPIDQYISTFNELAKQYMTIGISGERAGVVLNNLAREHIRLDIAKEVASQLGSALSSFSQNRNRVAFAAAIQGQNPFQAMANMAYTHDARGNPREGWVDEAASLADTYINTYIDSIGGDDDTRRWLLTDLYKQHFGLSQRSASMLASDYIENGNTEQFKKHFQQELEKADNPNATLEDLNQTALNYLQRMSRQLASADHLEADLKANLFKEAKHFGTVIDELLRSFAPLLFTIQGTILEVSAKIIDWLAELASSDLFSEGLGKIKDALSYLPIVLGTFFGIIFFKKLGGLLLNIAKALLGPVAGSLSKLLKNPRALSVLPKPLLGAALLAGAAYSFIDEKSSITDSVKDIDVNSVITKWQEKISSFNISNKPKTESIEESKLDRAISYIENIKFNDRTFMNIRYPYSKDVNRTFMDIRYSLYPEDISREDIRLVRMLSDGKISESPTKIEENDLYNQADEIINQYKTALTEKEPSTVVAGASTKINNKVKNTNQIYNISNQTNKNIPPEDIYGSNINLPQEQLINISQPNINTPNINIPDTNIYTNTDISQLILLDNVDVSQSKTEENDNQLININQAKNITNQEPIETNISSSEIYKSNILQFQENVPVEVLNTQLSILTSAKNEITNNIQDIQAGIDDTTDQISITTDEDKLNELNQKLFSYNNQLNDSNTQLANINANIQLVQKQLQIKNIRSVTDNLEKTNDDIDKNVHETQDNVKSDYISNHEDLQNSHMNALISIQDTVSESYQSIMNNVDEIDEDLTKREVEALSQAGQALGQMGTGSAATEKDKTEGETIVKGATRIIDQTDRDNETMEQMSNHVNEQNERLSAAEEEIARLTQEKEQLEKEKDELEKEKERLEKDKKELETRMRTQNNSLAGNYLGKTPALTDKQKEILENKDQMFEEMAKKEGERATKQFKEEQKNLASGSASTAYTTVDLTEDAKSKVEKTSRITSIINQYKIQKISDTATKNATKTQTNYFTTKSIDTKGKVATTDDIASAFTADIHYDRLKQINSLAGTYNYNKPIASLSYSYYAPLKPITWTEEQIKMNEERIKQQEKHAEKIIQAQTAGEEILNKQKIYPGHWGTLPEVKLAPPEQNNKTIEAVIKETIASVTENIKKITTYDPNTKITYYNNYAQVGSTSNNFYPVYRSSHNQKPKEKTKQEKIDELERNKKRILISDESEETKELLIAQIDIELNKLKGTDTSSDIDYTNSSLINEIQQLSQSKLEIHAPKMIKLEEYDIEAKRLARQQRYQNDNGKDDNEKNDNEKNDNEDETIDSAHESRQYYADKVKKQITREQHKEQVLSKTTYEILNDFMSLDIDLFGSLQMSIISEHEQIIQMIGVTHKLLTQINEITARAGSLIASVLPGRAGNTSRIINGQFENNKVTNIVYKDTGNKLDDLATYIHYVAEQQYGKDLPAYFVRALLRNEMGIDLDANPELAAINNFGGIKYASWMAKFGVTEYRNDKIPEGMPGLASFPDIETFGRVFVELNIGPKAYNEYKEAAELAAQGKYAEAAEKHGSMYIAGGDIDKWIQNHPDRNWHQTIQTLIDVTKEEYDRNSEIGNNGLTFTLETRKVVSDKFKGIFEGVENATITSGPGNRNAPTAGASTHHKGNDYAIETGTPIYSPGSGTVIHAGLLDGYGYTVIIKHEDNRETLFAHLSEIKVREGQQVKAGELIALSGGELGHPGAGTSTGPHLHFEVREHGTATEDANEYNQVAKQGIIPTVTLGAVAQLDNTGKIIQEYIQNNNETAVNNEYINNLFANQSIINNSILNILNKNVTLKDTYDILQDNLSFNDIKQIINNLPIENNKSINNESIYNALQQNNNIQPILQNDNITKNDIQQVINNLPNDSIINKIIINILKENILNKNVTNTQIRELLYKNINDFLSEKISKVVQEEFYDISQIDLKEIFNVLVADILHNNLQQFTNTNFNITDETLKSSSQEITNTLISDILEQTIQDLTRVDINDITEEDVTNSLYKQIQNIISTDLIDSNVFNIFKEKIQESLNINETIDLEHIFKTSVDEIANNDLFAALQKNYIYNFLNLQQDENPENIALGETAVLGTSQPVFTGYSSGDYGSWAICEPTAIATALTVSGIKKNPTEILNYMESTNLTNSPASVQPVLQHFGISSQYFDHATTDKISIIKQALRNNQTVIFGWGPEAGRAQGGEYGSGTGSGHYTAGLGIDIQGHIYMSDPGVGTSHPDHYKLSNKTLEEYLEEYTPDVWILNSQQIVQQGDGTYYNNSYENILNNTFKDLIHSPNYYYKQVQINKIPKDIIIASGEVSKIVLQQHQDNIDAILAENEIETRTGIKEVQGTTVKPAEDQLKIFHDQGLSSQQVPYKQEDIKAIQEQHPTWTKEQVYDELDKRAEYGLNDTDYLKQFGITVNPAYKFMEKTIANNLRNNIAPNGTPFNPDDIKKIMDTGKTRNDAIAILVTDDKYKYKPSNALDSRTTTKLSLQMPSGRIISSTSSLGSNGEFSVHLGLDRPELLGSSYTAVNEMPEIYNVVDVPSDKSIPIEMGRSQEAFIKQIQQKFIDTTKIIKEEATKSISKLDEILTKEVVNFITKYKQSHPQATLDEATKAAKQHITRDINITVHLKSITDKIIEKIRNMFGKEYAEYSEVINQIADIIIENNKQEIDKIKNKNQEQTPPPESIDETKGKKEKEELQ